MIVAITEQPYCVLDVRKENSRKYPNLTLPKLSAVYVQKRP